MGWQGIAEAGRAGRRVHTVHIKLHVQLGYALIPAASEYGKDCCCLYYSADRSVVALMN